MRRLIHIPVQAACIHDNTMFICIHRCLIIKRPGNVTACKAASAINIDTVVFAFERRTT